MDLERIEQDIDKIDGHAYNVGNTIDNIKAVMRDILSAVGELSQGCGCKDTDESE